MKVTVGTTKNGHLVSADTETSHYATHLEDTPHLAELVAHALPEIELSEDFQKIQYEFGYVTGKYDLVEIKPDEEVFYAIRKNRDRYIPFVKRTERPDATFISLHMRKLSEQEAELVTAYIGPITPDIPRDRSASAESIDFWSKHALVWGEQEVDEDTITTECPW